MLRLVETAEERLQVGSADRKVRNGAPVEVVEQLRDRGVQGTDPGAPRAPDIQEGRRRRGGVVVGGPLDRDLVPGAGAERFQWLIGDDPPILHDRDAVAEVLDLAESVAG